MATAKRSSSRSRKGSSEATDVAVASTPVVGSPASSTRRTRSQSDAAENPPTQVKTRKRKETDTPTRSTRSKGREPDSQDSDGIPSPSNESKKKPKMKKELTEAELMKRSAKRKAKRKKARAKKTKNMETARFPVAVPETEPSPKKQKVLPSIDVAVHRVRYVNYHPKPILCIRSTPPCGPKDYLAISRDNGCVEVRDANEKLRVIMTVAGYKNKPVNVLAWTCSHSSDVTVAQIPHLVGGCRDGSLFIIDSGSGLMRGMTHSGGGGVFALVSLCQRHCCEGACCQLVAAGCEDGSIRIYQVQAAQGNLVLVSTVPSAGAAVLSLAWVRKRSVGSHESSIFAGIADGTIRRYDFHGQLSKTDGLLGTWKPSIRMTVESLGRSTPTRVWALEGLADGTVISADSLGHVQFWNGKTGTLEQSFDQNENKADVLGLAVTSDESTVFASGVDSRVVCVERYSPVSEQALPSKKWVVTNAQRPHTHDVNSLAIYRVCRPDRPSKEILSTGGVDTKLCTYDTTNFRKGRPRVVYPWTSSSISVSSKARLFAMLREDTVDIFRLGHEIPKERLPLIVSESQALVGTIEIKGAANLMCSALSDDASFLAVANVSTLFVFRLSFLENGFKTEPLKIHTPEGFTVQAMCFHHTNQLYLAAGDGAVYILDLSAGSFRVSVCQDMEASIPASKSLVSTIYASQCGNYLATMRSSLVGTYIDVLKRDPQLKFRHWWTLPALEAGPSALSFMTGDLVRIAVACTDFSLFIFDVESRLIDKWSEAAGYPLTSVLPAQLRHRTDYPVRLFNDPSSEEKIFIGSFGAFVIFDLKERFPTECITFPEVHVRVQQRKRSGSVADKVKTSMDNDAEESEPAHCKLCLRYNSMLHLGYVGLGEMLVVEQPWLNVVATFPPALQRRVYGS